MATGLVLARQGLKVLVLEKERQLSGLVASYKIGSVSIERFYHHCFRSDKALLATLDDLKLSHVMEWKKGTSGFYYNGHIFPLNSAFEILRFPALGIWDKVRLAIGTRTAKSQLSRISELDRISAQQWILSQYGERVWRNFFRPLLLAKFGSEFSSISAAWLINRIALRSDREQSGEILGYPHHGFELIMRRLSEELQTQAQVQTGVSVERIICRNNRVEAVESSAGTFQCSSVVSTAHPAALQSFTQLPPDVAASLSSLRFQGAVCVLFGLKHPLQSSYWLNLGSSFPFGVLVEHTNFHEIPEYEGIKLLYGITYLDPSTSPLYKLTDSEITEIYVQRLEDSFNLQRKDILWSKVSRTPAAGLIYRMGLLQKLPPATSAIRGLVIGGMLRQYPERSINGCLEQAGELASCVRQSLDPYTLSS